jgi:TonB family protein
MLTIATGCRHPAGPAESGRSAFRFVDSPYVPPPEGAADGVVTAVGRQQYREASLLEPAIMPAYPARALAAKAGATTVGVHITVDEEGRVTDIRTSIWVVHLPGPFSEDFRAAVDAAVRQWRFVPAETVELEEVDQDGFAYVREKRREKVPTEFDLAFDFTPEGSVAARAQ